MGLTNWNSMDKTLHEKQSSATDHLKIRCDEAALQKGIINITHSLLWYESAWQKEVQCHSLSELNDSLRVVERRRSNVTHILLFM
jgi:hypothetical protein